MGNDRNGWHGQNNVRIDRALSLMLVALAIVLSIPAVAQDTQKNVRRYVPSTVSDGWHQVFEALPDPTKVPPLPGPNDTAGWKKVYDLYEQPALKKAAEVTAKWQLKVRDKNLGGVPVVEITPKGWVDNGKLLIYVHGGAYTMFSAHSSLPSAALVASRLGLRVLSVDYTNPPRARWQQVTDQVVSVFKALRDQGVKMQNLAIYGDSAGGGLAAGAVLKLRDSGLGMPAAVVLWSPWADITETGDTYVTLKEAEPNYLYGTVLGPSAAAYADLADQKQPYVSPVYGDFKPGYPPTLIQGGTREIFLSNFVRLYRAIDAGGQIATLDLYEGMPHVFQVKLPESPEAIMALNKMEQFLKTHLTK